MSQPSQIINMHYLVSHVIFWQFPHKLSLTQCFNDEHSEIQHLKTPANFQVIQMWRSLVQEIFNMSQQCNASKYQWIAIKSSTWQVGIPLSVSLQPWALQLMFVVMFIRLRSFFLTVKLSVAEKSIDTGW